MLDELPRYVRVARALALASGVALAGCASTTSGGDAGPTDGTSTDVAADMGPTDVAPACSCCPTGDWSGQCIMNPMQVDASHDPTPPPAGGRWCVGMENQSRGCPIAGPLPPPELAA